ncbi:MAG: hypothetical protein U0S12_01740 [Fimbriimonadales bacterium]
MNATRTLTAALAAAILNGSAMAQRGTPLPVSGGRSLPVIAYAPIDAQGNVIGAWRQPEPSDFSPNFIVFDNFEANPTGTGQPLEYRTPNWGEGSTRYWFGPGYKNCFCINDFTVVGGYAGKQVKRANFAFGMTSASAETVFVQIKVYDTFVNTATPPGATGFLSGYIAALGSVTPSQTNYFYGNLTLTGTDAWNMPADGSGAYEIKLLKQLSPETQCTEAQPMLWIIKPGQYDAGAQGPLQWDDDAPANNVHTSVELYDYSISDPFPVGNTTLEPMGAMMGFYADAPAIFCPTTINLLEGQDPDGTPDSVCTSDDVYYTAFNDSLTQGCSVELIGSVVNKVPGTLVFTMESSTARLGLQEQVALYKYTTNAYVTLNGRTATSTDSTISITRTADAAAYVNSSTGEVKARVKWGPINDEAPAFDGWLHLIDLANWNAY